MKTIIPALLILCACLCQAEQGPLNTAQLHIEGFLRCDSRLLAATYAPRVTLMPGHEFLKERYGIAGEEGRSKKLEVESERIIEALERVNKNRTADVGERIQKLLESLKYEQVEIEGGKLELDGDEHEVDVVIQEGDVFYKISPGESDFLLLHLRQIDGIWRVVSECID